MLSAWRWFALAAAVVLADQVSKALVTTNFLRLMGARMALGRDFTSDDGQPQPAQGHRQVRHS